MINFPQRRLINFPPADGFCRGFLKRGLDIIGAALLTVILSPLLLLIGLLIKLDSCGQMVYMQKRCGLRGRIFWIYKFRTMPANIEPQGLPVWAQEDDPRSTGLGLYLRRWHLDELPQLINVLKGEMSLVGPRPERPYFVEQFKEMIPGYGFRHRVKPGITGWAQINGYRGDSSIQKRVEFDNFYINNHSLTFDIIILFKTVFAREKLWVYQRTFSQIDVCLQNNPLQVPSKKA